MAGEILKGDLSAAESIELHDETMQPLTEWIDGKVFDWAEDPNATSPVLIPFDDPVLKDLYVQRREAVDARLGRLGWFTTLQPGVFTPESPSYDVEPLPTLSLRRVE